MEFRFEPELLSCMARRKRRCIAVEVAASNHSDIEVTELYLRLVSDDFARYLTDNKRYRRFDAPEATVLLPPYRLVCDDTVTFGLKRIWIFNRLTVQGIRL